MAGDELGDQEGERGEESFEGHSDEYNEGKNSDSGIQNKQKEK